MVALSLTRPGLGMLAQPVCRTRWRHPCLDRAASGGCEVRYGGAARAAYNWAVAYITAAWWQRRAEQSYGIAEDQLTKWRSWSLPSLRNAFNEDKRTNPRFVDWWDENSKKSSHSVPQGVADASRASRRWQ